VDKKLDYAFELKRKSIQQPRISPLGFYQIGLVMITVYVKHYLNAAGCEYFNTKWYPYVQSLIERQAGFISIASSVNKADIECINVVVKFTNAETLNAWVKTNSHQEIINDLDRYRTNGQRWFVAEANNICPPENIDEWEGG
jgi:antibiotic biosynthesis monooxygenase (ABM) superfamily enzyme